MRKMLLLVALYLLINLFSTKHKVFADKIFPANSVGSFGRSSKEPKYKIEFHPEDSPFHPEDDQESVIMPKQNGDKYLCFLPKAEKFKTEKLVPQQNTSSLIVESEKSLKLKTPDELLELLKDRCLLRQEGWWTYEFCYQQKLRQLHIEEDKVIQEFVLGIYDEEATAAHNQNVSDVSIVKDSRSRDASQRYHPHRYSNGTLCDLTNEPRETEVRFVCSEPRAMISSVTELSTCKYALTVQSPMLCKHPLFQEERPVWHTINCNALPKDHTKPKMEKDIQEEKINTVTDIEYAPQSDSEQYAT